MFPSSTSTSVLTRTARSTRQSGLKKPRPLRSISLQEKPTDNEVGRTSLERHLSTPDSTNGGFVGNDVHMCDGISAMSALIVAQNGSDTENHPADYNGKEEKRPLFDRQDSNSSYNSCLDSESGSSYHTISRQNSGFTTDVTRTVHFEHGSPTNFSEDSKTVDVNSNNISYKDSYQGSDSFCLSNNEDFSKIPLITLLTTQGEKLIVAGQNMPTILNASKILVREIGARIIYMQIEDLSDDSMHQPHTQTESPKQNNRESPSHTPETEEQVHDEKKVPVIRYSKKDLLAMSECETARKPPANWNILIHTHADCCLPADKMEYFEAIDFHAHDGTLVQEDRRLRERK